MCRENVGIKRENLHFHFILMIVTTDRLHCKMKRKHLDIVPANPMELDPAFQFSKEVVTDWKIGAAFVFQLTGKRYEIEESVPLGEVWKHLTFYGTKNTVSVKLSQLVKLTTEKKAVLKTQEAFLKRYGLSTQEAIKRPGRGRQRQGQAPSTLVRIFTFPILMEYLGVPIYKCAARFLVESLTQENYLALLPRDVNVCILLTIFLLFTPANFSIDCLLIVFVMLAFFF